MQCNSFNSKWQAAGLLSILMLFCCSCGGGATAPAVEAQPQAAYSLRVLSDSFIDGGSSDFRITEKTLADGGVELTLTANDARGLKALYVELDYDASLFAAPAIEEGSALGHCSGSLSLQLSQSKETGRLQHGEVLLDFDRQRGLYGSAELLHLKLLPAGAVAAAVPARQMASLEDSAYASRLRFNPELRELSFSYSALGDYDQNGEVAISDLTPLGQHFGEKQNGGFDYSSVLSVVDGDGNGEIGISDITPIGAHFGTRVEGFRLYGVEQHEANAAYPQDGAVSSSEPIAWLPLTESIEDEGQRRHCVMGTASQPYGMVYWLRAEGNGLEGLPSNRSDKGFAGAAAPEIALNVQGAEGPTPLQLLLNASGSTDSDGDIISYAFVRADAPGAMLSSSPLYSEDLLVPANLSYYVYAIDDDGVCAMTPAVQVSPTLAGDHAPQLDALFPSGLTGDAPFELFADMSGSSDLDGDLVSYSMLIWAYGGNGVALLSEEGVEPVMDYSFTEPGNYQLRLSVEQQNGLEDHRYFLVRVLDSGNALPIVGLAQNKDLVDSGEAITFYLTTDSMDSDGSIVKYEIDPLGSGQWIEFSFDEQDFIYAYSEAGYYRPRLRATDDRGAMAYSGQGYVEVYGNPGTPPQAMLELTPQVGAAPLKVQLDGSGSLDTNGIIVEYFFDLGDGNGFVSNGSSPVLEHVFPIGTHSLRLRVLDNQGLSAESEGAVTALLPL